MSAQDASLSRSVKDFRSEEELKAVLAQGIHVQPAKSNSVLKESSSKEHFDAATMEENSVEKESKRLMVLKSLQVLDETNDEGLDRLTGMAARVFNVPICLVSLVDLGRLWFVSNHGLGNVRSIDRLES